MAANANKLFVCSFATKNMEMFTSVIISWYTFPYKINGNWNNKFNLISSFVYENNGYALIWDQIRRVYNNRSKDAKYLGTISHYCSALLNAALVTITFIFILYMICNVRKHTFGHVRPRNIQTSLRFLAVWSESSLGARNNKGYKISSCGQRRL